MITRKKLASPLTLFMLVAALLSVPSAVRAQFESGACCAPDGTCSVTLSFLCILGIYQGDGTSCTPGLCLGACCQANGTCAQTGSLSCTILGGEFHGLRSSCAGRDCDGACCGPDGACFITGPSGCASSNGIFNGFPSVCADVRCRGACCFGKKECTETGQVGCAEIPGEYQGGGSTCEFDCPSPMPTAFTYQGQLKEGGVPFNGTVAMLASLWAKPVAGDFVAGLVFDSINVENGLFTIELDFGVPAFNTNARWLEIEVCPHAQAAGLCELLNPRQPLTPAPYALQTRGLFVDASQRVGVGTKNPDSRVHAVAHLDYGGTGVHGYSNAYDGNGVIGKADGPNVPYGVWGISPNGYAGYFDGSVHIQGNLTKLSGSFRIDHPLDPENKYLSHSFVESPDMMNVYNGNVTLDGNGEVWVELPAYFEALNSDFRYQLSAIGSPGPNLFVAAEIAQSRFKIAGWPGRRSPGRLRASATILMPADTASKSRRTKRARNAASI